MTQMPSTTSTETCSFGSRHVKDLFAFAQEELCQTLMSLAAFIYLFATTLTLKIDFGGGYTAATTITADPMQQPGDPAPIPDSTSAAATALIRNKISDFMASMHIRFEELVRTYCMRPAVLVIDLRIGESNEVRSTVRVVPHKSMAVLSPFRPSKRLLRDVGDTNLNDDNDDNADCILLLPLTKDSLAAAVNFFCPGRYGSDSSSSSSFSCPGCSLCATRR